MHCNRAQAWMDRYLGGDLASHEQEAFEAHLRDCRDCQEQLFDLRRLVIALQDVPAPPVPRELVGCVMARARKEIQETQHVAGPHSDLSMWWYRTGISGLGNTIAAIAAGLAIGLTLGQQTWRHTTNANELRRPTAAIDATFAYSLDYLSAPPRGSFMETYLSLTKSEND